MGWKVPDLSDYLYAAARNGGPIGMSSICLGARIIL
jgi:hypothetical protein